MRVLQTRFVILHLLVDSTVKVSVPANKEGTKFRMIEIDSKFADKVYTFTRAMNKKYGVYVTSAFRSKTKQLAMRTAWDSGNRKGLKARPGKTSAHSSGFALELSMLLFSYFFDFNYLFNISLPALIETYFG